MAYPVDVAVEFGDGSRSRGKAVLGIFAPIKLLLAFPHLFLLGFVQIAAMFASWFGYWGIAFTGSLSPGIARFVHSYMGWYLRTGAWLLSWNDEYPQFAMEQPEYPAKVIVTEPTLQRSRGLAVAGILWFAKAILLIPHFIVLYVLGIAAGIAAWFAYWAIAFTGYYPEGVFTFTVGVARWYLRMLAWLLSITDEYPPFQLGE